jgi:hypothetical protein
MLDCRLYLPASWDPAQLPEPVSEEQAQAAAEDGGARAAARRKVRAAMNSSKKASPQLVKAAAAGGITQTERDVLAAQIDGRRSRARIPDEVVYQAKWQLALEMIDELTSWGLAPPVIVGDAGYGQGDLRAALADRRLRYMLAIQPTLTVHAHDAVLIPAQGRRHAHYATDPASVRTIAVQAGRAAFRKTTWRQEPG